MYRFRIKFIITTSSFLGIDEPEFEIKLSSGTYNLKSESGNNINESKELILTSEGFETAEAALAEGNHVMDALRWCSARLRIGINLGNNKINGGLSDFYRELIYKESGIKVLNGVHGLMVYEDAENLKIASTKATAIITKAKDSFSKEFHDFHYTNKKISEQIALAFEFYNLAQQFEASLRVKFLLYIITIESLVEQKERRKEAASHVDELIAFTENNKDLTLDERRSIISSLEYLRKESISASGKKFVGNILDGKRYGGKSVKKFFKDCYDIRSEFVHNGKWDEQKESLTYEVENMVTDLLITLVESNAANS